MNARKVGRAIKTGAVMLVFIAWTEVLERWKKR